MNTEDTQGGLLRGPQQAYLKFSGNMRNAFDILTNEMDKKGDQTLVSHGKQELTYREAANELKRTPDLNATEYDTRLAQQLNKALTDTVKNVTPQVLAATMKDLVNISANYLAQHAEFNKDKGPAFNLLIKQIKDKGNEKLFQTKKRTRTYAQCAKELQEAKGLETDHDESNLSLEIHAGLRKAVDKVTPNEMKRDMDETLDVCSKYLSGREIEESKQGPVFALLVKELEDDGAAAFTKEFPALDTKYAAAQALKSAPGLSSDNPDKQTVPRFAEALHKAVDTATPKQMVNEMRDIVNQSAEYLSGFVRDRGPAMDLLVKTMKAEPNKDKVLAKRNSYSMNYETGAAEIESHPVTPIFPVKDIADEIKGKLSADMKNVTPPALTTAMKSVVGDVSKHLSQAVALRSGAAGERYAKDLLTATMKSLGNRQLFQYKSYEQTYSDGAEELKYAGPPQPLESKHGNLHAEIRSELNYGVPSRLAPPIAEGLTNTINDSAKHLAKASAEKGEAFDHLIKVMKEEGDKPLGMMQGYSQTYNDGARRLEAAPSLATEKVDKATYDSVKGKLTKLTDKKPVKELKDQMPGIVDESSKFLSAPVSETEADKRQLLADMMSRKGDQELTKDGIYKMTYHEGGQEIKKAPFGVVKSGDASKQQENLSKINSALVDRKMQERLKQPAIEGAAHITDIVRGRGEAMQVIHDDLKKAGDKNLLSVGSVTKSHAQAADMLAKAANFEGLNPSPQSQGKVNEMFDALPKTGASENAKKYMDETKNIASAYVAGIAEREGGVGRGMTGSGAGAGGGAVGAGQYGAAGSAGQPGTAGGAGQLGSAGGAGQLGAAGGAGQLGAAGGAGQLEAAGGAGQLSSAGGAGQLGAASGAGQLGAAGGAGQLGASNGAGQLGSAGGAGQLGAAGGAGQLGSAGGAGQLGAAGGAGQFGAAGGAGQLGSAGGASQVGAAGGAGQFGAAGGAGQLGSAGGAGQLGAAGGVAQVGAAGGAGQLGSAGGAGQLGAAGGAGQYGAGGGAGQLSGTGGAGQLGAADGPGQYGPAGGAGQLGAAGGAGQLGGAGGPGQYGPAGGTGQYGAGGGAGQLGAAGGAGKLGAAGGAGSKAVLRRLQEKERKRKDGVRSSRLSSDGAEYDPEREAALKVLHKELQAKGNEILYKQPLTELTHSQASTWLRQKSPKKVDKTVKESPDTARLHKKFEKRLGGLVSKNTPPAMQETMQDVVIESSRNLSEYFVAENYKAQVKNALISEMQKKGNEILLEVNGAAETYLYASQRLKKAKTLEVSQPCEQISHFVEKQLDGMIRHLSLPRKLGSAMKEHIKEASDYLSVHVTKPDEHIEAYVALLGEMEAAGDALLITGHMPKSYKDAAAYLRQLTSNQDNVNQPNSVMQSAIASKLKDLMAKVPPRGYTRADMDGVIVEQTKLLVSYITAQGDRTVALKLLVVKLDETGDAVLLRHGVIKKTHADGANILRGKTADQLDVTSADPVVSRKIQIKLISLMQDSSCAPEIYRLLMDEVIEDATNYLAVNILQPKVIQVCKCMKSVFVQCELWCDEMLRRVARPCCPCSRHGAAQARAGLAPAQRLRVSADNEMSVRQCPSHQRHAQGPCPAPRPSDGCGRGSTQSYMLYSTSYPLRRSRIPPRASSRASSDSPRNASPERDHQASLLLCSSLRERPCSRSPRSAPRVGSVSPSDSLELHSTPNRRKRAVKTPSKSFKGSATDSTETPPTPSTSLEPVFPPTPDSDAALAKPLLRRCSPIKSQQHKSAGAPSCPAEQGTSKSTSKARSHSESYLANVTTSRLPIATKSGHSPPTISTDQMSDWHAMMISLMWNVQAWRDWIQENIDRALTYHSDPEISMDEADVIWESYQRKLTSEALQWRQYNIFSRQLTLRLVLRYRDKKIISPTRATDKTDTYLECQQEMLEIVQMFNRWTHWLTAVVKESNLLTNVTGDVHISELRWSNFKRKVKEYAGDWDKYNEHLRVCWEQKYRNLIADWLPTWQQPGPVWVVSACGAVPSGAVAAGECGGELVWVARTTHRCKVLPAALHPSKHCCIVYADGEVYHYTKYQVMCNGDAQWVPWRGGAAGARAVRVAAGVLVGRVRRRGAHLVGAVRAPRYRCHVVICGRPFAFNCYELLVLPGDV